MLQSMGLQRVDTTERLNKNNKEATLVSLRCLLGTSPESPRLRFRASIVGSWVHCLVGELKSHILHEAAK